jgi:hypothetical protein
VRPPAIAGCRDFLPSFTGRNGTPAPRLAAAGDFPALPWLYLGRPLATNEGRRAKYLTGVPLSTQIPIAPACDATYELPAGFHRPAFSSCPILDNAACLDHFASHVSLVRRFFIVPANVASAEFNHEALRAKFLCRSFNRISVPVTPALGSCFIHQGFCLCDARYPSLPARGLDVTIRPPPNEPIPKLNAVIEFVAAPLKTELPIA